MNPFSRTQFLLGSEAMEKLKKARVAVFGLGGVGSWCCEALGRAGIGALSLIDHDTVSESNINRQLCALSSTLDMPKAEVLRRALAERGIDPDDAVMVGDTRGDVEAGKGAGLYTIGCTWGYGTREELEGADERRDTP